MRKRREFDDGLVQQVAKWFYEKNTDKTQIAAKVVAKTREACDRHTVNKILKLARDRGLVHIDFPEIVPPEIKLARRVKTAFPHLQKVIVLPNREGETYEELLVRWAEAAANYFEELLKEIPKNQWPLHIGVGGGDTSFAVVNAIREEPRPDIHIHTTALVGWGEFERERGSSPKTQNDEDLPYHIDPITNATILWNKFGRNAGRCHYATVPPLTVLQQKKPRRELERLYELSPIRKIVDGMKDVRIAFAGLGIFSPIKLVGQNNNQLTVASLLPDGATSRELAEVRGDLSYTLFDKDGLSRPEWEFFLTAGFGEGHSGLRFYQDMVESKSPQKYVIVVAGMRKHLVLLPALRAKFFNIWITDAASASFVLANAARGRAGISRGGG